MQNENTQIEVVGNAGGRGKTSSLALRIRRAAQLATAAKAKTKAKAADRAEAEAQAEAANGQVAARSTRTSNGRKRTAGNKAGKGGEAVNVFQRYLRSLRAAEVLPPEEEKRLALLYRDHKDSDAASRLVRGNLRLVVKIAEEYGR